MTAAVGSMKERAEVVGRIRSELAESRGHGRQARSCSKAHPYGRLFERAKQVKDSETYLPKRHTREVRS